MKYIVYKTTCLINGKYYIGKHQTENPDIFDGYLGNSVWVNRNDKLKNPEFPFHFAVKKYGVKNFKRETLFIFDTAKEAFAKEAELVNEDFIKRDDNYNVVVGGKGGKQLPRLVYRFNFQGNLIEEFKNVYIAAEAVHRSYTNINDAIHNKRTCASSLWSDKKEIDISKYKITSTYTYYIYDSDGYYIREFNSNEECIEFLETNRANLTRAIKLQNKINGYFISTEKHDKIRIQATKLNGKLNRYTLDGHYIDSFESAAQARQVLGLKLASLSQAIRLKRQCNGYRWTRCDNPSEYINI